jgi:tetratricopeptide (TPR) repeat protein
MNHTSRIVLVVVAAAVVLWYAWPRPPQASRTARVTAVAGRDALPLGAGTSRAALDEIIAAGRARVAADPSDAVAGVALADALLRKARVASDAGCAIEAERVLRAVLEREPGEYSALKLLGAVYLSQHRFRDAIAAATRAKAVRADDAWHDGVLGDAYLELGEYDRAFEAFDAMVRRRPDAASYARVAYALELQGRLPDALVQMRRAAEATGAGDPESLAWHYAQIGNLHFQMGDLDSAAREYARADHAFPGHPYARVGLARVAAARGDLTTALGRYRELFDEAATPELAAAIGDLLNFQGDRAAALSMYERAEMLERDGWKSEEPQPAALARLLAERGLKPEEAVRLAMKAASERADIATLDALAWACFQAGRLEDARAASERARRTGTADRRVLYHAAAIEHALGNDQEARRLLSRAIDGHPRFDLIAAPAALALSRQLGGIS